MFLFEYSLHLVTLQENKSNSRKSQTETDGQTKTNGPQGDEYNVSEKTSLT